MSSRFSWFAGLACMLALSFGCAPIHYGEQELFLAHEAKADSLRLLIVYDAIQAQAQDHDDGSKTGRDFAAHVNSGRREFMIYDWPFHFDVDESLKSGDTAPGDRADPWNEWFRDLRVQAAGLKVVDSGYFAGSLGRLGMYQQLQIANANHLVLLFERSLHMWINDEVKSGQFELETPWLDARSRGMWIAMARDKQSWLSLKDGVLTADLPASNACTARMLAELTRSSAEKTVTARFIAGLCSHLSELKIADDRIVLRWNLNGPTWTFSPPESQNYDGSLAESLRTSKALPQSLPSRDDVSAGFKKR